MKINAIITGATGMVGEGVLQECLIHPDVEKILVINRKPCGVSHPKLTEIIHQDFLDLSPVSDRMKGYNACFFCLGVSSVGMKRDKYFALTYTLTLNMAKILVRLNPSMTFCYVSGAGTDSTEKGRSNWARVKGKTENDLIKLPFKKVFAFRPGFMLQSKDARNAHGYYNLFKTLYPALKTVFPSFVSTLRDVALGMINSVIYGYDKNVLELKDILILAKKQ